MGRLLRLQRSRYGAAAPALEIPLWGGCSTLEAVDCQTTVQTLHNVDVSYIDDAEMETEAQVSEILLRGGSQLEVSSTGRLSGEYMNTP